MPLFCQTPQILQHQLRQRALLTSPLQMVYVIDSVLEPLLTNSIRNASLTQHITAGKLLARSDEIHVLRIL